MLISDLSWLQRDEATAASGFLTCSEHWKVWVVFLAQCPGHGCCSSAVSKLW